MPKDTVRVSLLKNPCLNYSGELIECDDREFVEKAGGALAIALFKGEFQSTLWTYLDIARARGKAQLHASLMAQSSK